MMVSQCRKEHHRLNLEHSRNKIYGFQPIIFALRPHFLVCHFQSPADPSTALIFHSQLSPGLSDVSALHSQPLRFAKQLLAHSFLWPLHLACAAVTKVGKLRIHDFPHYSQLHNHCLPHCSPSLYHYPQIRQAPE